jgi:hypothetical protein
MSYLPLRTIARRTPCSPIWRRFTATRGLEIFGIAAANVFLTAAAIARIDGGARLHGLVMPQGRTRLLNKHFAACRQEMASLFHFPY